MPARTSKKNNIRRSSKKMNGGSKRTVRRTSKSSKKTSKKMYKKKTIRGGGKCITFTDGKGNEIIICDNDNLSHARYFLEEQAKGDSELLKKIKTIMDPMRLMIESGMYRAKPIQLTPEYWNVLNVLRGQNKLINS